MPPLLKIKVGYLYFVVAAARSLMIVAKIVVPVVSICGVLLVIYYVSRRRTKPKGITVLVLLVL